MQAELDACKKIDGARPDAYFNEGILTQEYKAKGAGGTDKAIGVYQQAKQVFQAFVDKAAGKPEYDGAVKKAKERMQDIDDTITFLQAGGPASGSPPPPPAPGVERQQRGPGRQRCGRRPRPPGPDGSAPGRQTVKPHLGNLGLLRMSASVTQALRDTPATSIALTGVPSPQYTHTVIRADYSTLGGASE